MIARCHKRSSSNESCREIPSAYRKNMQTTEKRSRSSSVRKTFSEEEEELEDDRPMWGSVDETEYQSYSSEEAEEADEDERTRRQYRGRFRWDYRRKRNRRSRSSSEEEQKEVEDESRSNRRIPRTVSPVKRKRVDMEKDLVKCDQCDVKKLTLKGVVHHQLNQHGLGIECTSCHEKFNTNETWKEHCEDKHPEKRVQCIYCKSLFEIPAHINHKRWEFIFKHIYAELLYARLAEYQDGCE